MTDWPERLTSCRRRASVVYPEFLRARAVYQRLDRCHTYWSNRAFEAEKEVKKQEGSITLVPKDETKDSMEKAKEKFHRMFSKMSKVEQEMVVARLME